jgi:hypothetical protein
LVVDSATRYGWDVYVGDGGGGLGTFGVFRYHDRRFDGVYVGLSVYFFLMCSTIRFDLWRRAWRYVAERISSGLEYAIQDGGGVR